MTSKVQSIALEGLLSRAVYVWTATGGQTTFLGSAALDPSGNAQPRIVAFPGKLYCQATLGRVPLRKEDFTVVGNDFVLNFANVKAGEVLEVIVESTLPVGVPAAGSITSTELADDSVLNSKLANVPTATFKGRSSPGLGDLEDLTVTQAKLLLGMYGNLAGWDVYLDDTKATGTDGGASVATTTVVRTLNTEYDPFNYCTLSANQFTLVQGTYQIDWGAPAFGADRHQCYLRNVTLATTQSSGRGGYSSGASASTQDWSTGTATVVVPAGGHAFELRHYTQTARATNGLGVNSNMGLEEHYTWVKIKRIG